MHFRRKLIYFCHVIHKLAKMADDGSEKKFFGNVVRNKTKYGSTTNPGPKYVKYVKHNVSRVDTLQGIALRYGATVSLFRDLYLTGAEVVQLVSLTAYLI